MAYNGVGNSEYSNVASDTTNTEALKAPTNLRAESISTNQINLSWEDNNSNETGFVLERATKKSAFFIKIADLKADSTTYKDSGLSPDTFYRYRIKAYNASQESDYSDTLSVKTDNAPPATPTNLVTTPSIVNIRLEWKDNSTNELGFIIERIIGKATAFTRIDTVNSDNTSYLDDNLTMGGLYTYRVSAYNTEGNSEQSNITQARTFTFETATTNAPFSARYGHTTAAYDNKLWVIGGIDAAGRKNDVWYSTDGVTWTEATSSAAFSARFSHTTAVYDNKLWVIGGDIGIGYKNDVWHSTDGVIWTEATPSAAFLERRAHATAVYDNKLWVIGGDTAARRNDVWYSTDGVTWTEATSTASFSKRRGHTLTVFDNKLWVIGGLAGAGIYGNDVWYSTNGVTWTEATPSAAFLARFNHTTAVFDNKLWVIAGADGGLVADRKNDIWQSADGVTWIEATPSAPFSARVSHATAIFGNKLWVIGGLDGSRRNDVWVLPD